MPAHAFTPKARRSAIPYRGFLLVILGVLALGLISLAYATSASSRSSTRPESSHADWSNLYPDLQDISVVSEDDAWAVSTRGDLYHYLSGEWAFVETPQFDGISPRDLEMLSATDGWLITQYRAFQYDGTDWVEKSNGLHDPIYGGYPVSVQDIVPLAPDDVWALGHHSSGQSFLHWDGIEWIPTGPVVNVTLNSLAMSGPDDGWAVGSACAFGSCYGYLYHYDGVNWQQVSNPTGTSPLNGVWASPDMPGEAWITTGSSFPQHPSAVYHYVAGSWEAQSAPANSNPTTIFMSSPDEGWALGSLKSILHWDGTSWSIEYTSDFSLVSLSGAPGRAWAAGNGSRIVSRPEGGSWASEHGSPTTNDLTAISMLSADDAWAVGAYGTTIHYDGTDWQSVPPGFSNTLLDVQMLASDDVYAVGGNIIAHWDGSLWSSIALTNSTNLSSISMASPDEGWAVGGIGGNQSPVMWQYTGGQWSEVPNSFTGSLVDVAMDSPTHGWVVGSRYQSSFSGLLLEYVAGDWVDRSDLVPDELDMLDTIALSPDGSEGWIAGNTPVGYEQPFLHLVGGVWSLDPYISDRRCVDLKMLSEDDLWGACDNPDGYYGGVVHHAGGQWTERDIPMRYSPSGIAILPGVGGWAVGRSGTIAQYDPALPPPPPTNTMGPSATPTLAPPSTAITPSATSIPPTATPVQPTATATSTPLCPLLTWRTVPSSIIAIWRAVEVIGPDDIWVVGQGGAIAHYDGTGWTQVDSPTIEVLSALSATSSTDVWAAGSPGILHWNGTEWSLVYSGPDEEFSGITALSPIDVWAVGIGPGIDWPATSITVHWDGSAWTHVPVPVPSGRPSSLASVSALSSTDIWAVGSWSKEFGFHPFIVHWDGAQWVDESSSFQSPCGFSGLIDLATISATDIWAIGYCISGSHLVVHYDGTTWAAISTPDIGHLSSVSALTTGDVWIAGGEGILHWNGSDWEISSDSGSRVFSIYPSAPDDLWGVGYDIFHYTEELFVDVQSTNVFYPYIQCLACQGIISGYEDGTFRPNADVTRGQIAKIVSNAAGFNEDAGEQIYEDVPIDNTFYAWINRLSRRGYMSGYPCGTVPQEPCGIDSKPYFRPGSTATRGQLAKIVSNAAGYGDTPPDQLFTDVAPDHPFYIWVQRLASRGFIGGYPCGGPGEPCDGQNRPYFRAYNNVTRGQTSKIVANTFFPECATR